MKILSGKYVNTDGTAVVVVTDTDPSVLVTEASRPALWAELQLMVQAGEIVIADFEPPEPQGE